MEFLQPENNKSAFDVPVLNTPKLSAAKKKVLVLFGTRPEAIKLAPVIHELAAQNFQTAVVSSGQHTDLLAPFLKLLRIKTDYSLQVMTENQTPSSVLAKTLQMLDEILAAENPDVIIVQGDTTTTLAGALAGFNRRILVAHVEAGLRSGNLHSPFPEEMNRRMVSQAATLHFCATPENRQNLLAENVCAAKIFVTGNTVVDALDSILKKSKPSPNIRGILNQTKQLKRILLTTHRRESFGAEMNANLREIKNFVEKHADVCVFFPVHPNPNVRRATEKILARHERIYLLEPLVYTDFVALMKSAWLIVSDSGGVQEEAPSLGKPLLILRENTERPEAIRAGIAKLVGKKPKALAALLEENYADETWINSVRRVENPFGRGDSAARIVKILTEHFSRPTPKRGGVFAASKPVAASVK